MRRNPPRKKEKDQRILMKKSRFAGRYSHASKEDRGGGRNGKREL